MEEKTTEVKVERHLAEKKIYTPPTLNIYGKLTDLTGGGSNAMPEPHTGANPSPLTEMS
jgi:hypothetical protein